MPQTHDYKVTIRQIPAINVFKIQTPIPPPREYFSPGTSPARAVFKVLHEAIDDKTGLPSYPQSTKVGESINWQINVERLN